MTFSTFDTEFNDLYILCHNIIKNKRYIVTIYLLFKKWLSNCLRAHSKGPLIKQIIRILFVLNPSPQLFIIGFYIVIFLHHEEVIGLYQTSYIREFSGCWRTALIGRSTPIYIIPGRKAKL